MFGNNGNGYKMSVVTEISEISRASVSMATILQHNMNK